MLPKHKTETANFFRNFINLIINLYKLSINTKLIIKIYNNKLFVISVFYEGTFSTKTSFPVLSK